MADVTIGVIKYYLKENSYYIVGDNSTTYGNGIASTSYSGNLEIPVKVKGLNIYEIGQYAFGKCYNIVNVTIYARLRRINRNAFGHCRGLMYLNIPATVTFIGYAAIWLGDGDTLIDLPMTVEFESGRTQNIFIDGDCFSIRSVYYIIYPSEFIPVYTSKYAFYKTSTYYICAPKVFDFYTKQTTIDQSKCPSPKAKNKYRTKNVYRRRVNIVRISSIIALCTKTE